MIDYYSKVPIKKKKKDRPAASQEDVAYCFEPIAFVRSPFSGKFGVPRQPSLVQSAKGLIKFKNDPDIKTALKAMEQFTHLWVVFVFHAHGGRNWKPSIRPPRLGGRQKVGVLASRSPHRPNPLGLSVVGIEKVDLDAVDGPEISIAGLDLLDGTPVLDVKPYIPYADHIPGAKGGWAEAPIEKVEVLLTAEAQCALKSVQEIHPEFAILMMDLLQIDPRPAHQKRQFPVGAAQSEGLHYGIEIAGVEVKYQIQDGRFEIYRIEPSKSYCSIKQEPE